MRNALIAAFVALLVGAGTYAVADSGSSGDSSSATDITTTTPETTNTQTTPAPAPQPAGDISGPCDEAEHANDPRCTGAATDDASEDNSGPGGGDDSGHGGGGNSGPG